MVKMTSAYANKLLKRLNDDKVFLLNKEAEGKTYDCALDEEPLIPDYDYKEVQRQLEEIDEKIIIIKHAVNTINVSSRIDVRGKMMSVDEILVKMAQLNRRKITLDIMRKAQPKKRIDSGFFSTKKTTPEYRYVNYDIEAIKVDYDSIDAEISAMQIALDRFNQTFEFDVDVDI